jgi:hypothetical protein
LKRWKCLHNHWNSFCLNCYHYFLLLFKLIKTTFTNNPPKIMNRLFRKQGTFIICYLLKKKNHSLEVYISHALDAKNNMWSKNLIRTTPNHWLFVVRYQCLSYFVVFSPTTFIALDQMQCPAMNKTSKKNWKNNEKREELFANLKRAFHFIVQ